MESLRKTSTLGELRELLDRPADVKGGAIALREGTAEMHYFVARSELRQKQAPKHGLTHLADLLAVDPANAEWLALIDTYERTFGALESLLEPEHGHQRYYATEALRAYLWARAGRGADAIDLLVQVARAKPSVRYLDAWALPWLEHAGGLGVLGADGALQLLSAVLPSFAEAHESSERLLRSARRWAALGVAFTKSARVDAATAGLYAMLVGGICRKAGLFAEGLAVADAQAHPSWHAWTARGLLLRRQGSLDAALDAFVQAGRCDPSDLSWMLEAGDMFFEHRRWSDARNLYERVLAREPQHPWALPSAAFCRWRERSSARFPDASFPRELGDLARQGNGRARGLYDTFRAWKGVVPEPRDATTNSIRQIAQQLPPESAKPGSTFRMSLSDVEPPSNQVLLHAIYGGALSMPMTYSNVAHPDPREPHAPVAFTLGRREGEALVPAMPEPPRAISDGIGALAAIERPLGEAWGAAGRLAATLGRDHAAGLLACVVRPPPVPAGTSVFAWIPRVQLAVALVVANLADGEPWERSVRRDALLSLLHGPMDWSTESAIVALARLSWDEPAILTEVHRAFATLLAARPRSGAVCWEETLLDQWLDLPGLYPQEREELGKRYDALQQRSS